MTGAGRVAEHVVRSGLFGPKLRVRVDLHGVSLFGAEGRHTLIRWEWIESIDVDNGVVVRAANAGITFPPGSFRRPPAQLADQLREAVGIDRRAEVIASLSAG